MRGVSGTQLEHGGVSEKQRCNRAASACIRKSTQTTIGISSNHHRWYHHTITDEYRFTGVNLYFLIERNNHFRSSNFKGANKVPVSSQVPSACSVSELSAALNDGSHHALLYASFPELAVIALLSTLIVYIKASC